MNHPQGHYQPPEFLIIVVASTVMLCWLKSDPGWLLLSLLDGFPVSISDIIYIDTHIITHMYIYIYIFRHIHIYKHISIYIYISVYIYIYTRTTPYIYSRVIMFFFPTYQLGYSPKHSVSIVRSSELCEAVDCGHPFRWALSHGGLKSSRGDDCWIMVECWLYDVFFEKWRSWPGTLWFYFQHIKVIRV
jgi:hypothetical protein